MNNEPKPDLASDAELLECSAVLANAYFHDGKRVTEEPAWWQNAQEDWLAVADRARTFFGAGYRLPEANEANAERLARAVARHTSFSMSQKLCVELLEAQAIAFAEPGEKPESVFLTAPTCPETLDGERCNLAEGHEGAHESEQYSWPASSVVDQPSTINIQAEADANERRRLREAFMLALAGNPAVMAKLIEDHESVEQSIAVRLSEQAEACVKELIA